MRRIRCAIYTRKSTEEGLEQEFNSLHAQREACEAYIASQKHEGWKLISRAYDDGGISGGHLDRPALQRLMQDVDDKQVDQIVVYKIDRLTRSLADFAKLVDRLDAANASFVSVTQSFNTATSMGRLTLNVLLSFAQFEREVTAERIRDTIAASKRKGLWMGGSVPLGYQADGRTLKIDDDEAETIRTLFDLYETHGTLNIVTEAAMRLGLRSRRRQTKAGGWRGGNVLLRGHIYHILTSPIYAGRIPHKGKTFEGQHPAIIDPERWEQIQDRLKAKAPVDRNGPPRVTNSSPLMGKLFDEQGQRLSPSHSKKRGRRYRYYISAGYKTRRKETLQRKGWRLPAEDLEQFMALAVRRHLAGQCGATLVPNASIETLQHLRSLAELDGTEILSLLRSAQLGEGGVSLQLDGTSLAQRLDLENERIDSSRLDFDVPFTRKRRGVETRLVMPGQGGKVDEALVANIARAHAWLNRIKKGESLNAIAKVAGTSKKRVQQTLDYAFLAPDIVRGILAGNQPIGMTTTWIATHAIPSDWAEQRALIETL
jgi:DNA invertase Pin-like site-specific DNA recombinase